MRGFSVFSKPWYLIIGFHFCSHQAAFLSCHSSQRYKDSDIRIKFSLILFSFIYFINVFFSSLMLEHKLRVNTLRWHANLCGSILTTITEYKALYSNIWQILIFILCNLLPWNLTLCSTLYQLPIKQEITY